jgi:hypothetical protein
MLTYNSSEPLAVSIFLSLESDFPIFLSELHCLDELLAGHLQPSSDRTVSSWL